MIVQRYATDEQGRPVVEVVEWMQTSDDDPRGVELAGGEGGRWMWASASMPLAPVHEQIAPAVVDELTGVVLDPGGTIVDPSLYWPLYDLPLRPGWTEITREEYAALVADRPQTDGDLLAGGGTVDLPDLDDSGD